MCALGRSVDWVYLLEMRADMYPGSGMPAAPHHSYYTYVFVYTQHASLCSMAVLAEDVQSVFYGVHIFEFEFLSCSGMLHVLEPGRGKTCCYPCLNKKWQQCLIDLYIYIYIYIYIQVLFTQYLAVS